MANFKDVKPLMKAICFDKTEYLINDEGTKINVNTTVPPEFRTESRVTLRVIVIENSDATGSSRAFSSTTASQDLLELYMSPEESKNYHVGVEYSVYAIPSKPYVPTKKSEKVVEEDEPGFLKD